MDHELQISVEVEGQEYQVRGFYERESGIFEYDVIFGDVSRYLSGKLRDEILDSAAVEANKQEAERRVEEATDRGKDWEK